VGALLLLVALLFLPSFAPYLLRFDHWTADLRTAYLADTPFTQDRRIALVVINDDTLKDYASSPIDRGLLARIVTAIDKAGAESIGIDVLFLKRTEPDKDAALLAALRDARAQVVLGYLDTRGELQPFQRQFQAEFLRQTGLPAGYLNLHHDRDDVVRYTSAPAADDATGRSFASLLAATRGGTSRPDTSRPIPWLGRPANGSDTFLAIKAQDLLADASKGAALEGRIVLVGGDFPLRDRHRIPLSSRTGETVPGVAIHAHVIAAMLDPRRAISELGPLAARGVLLAVSVIGFLIGWLFWQSPIVDSLRAGFATAALIGLDAFCYTELRLLLPFTLTLVAWLAGLTAGRSIRSCLPALVSRRLQT
jgi:adenylate cyclase